ncbi:S8 family peptidase [Microbulbifer halophilus]|uniref:S8 family serine peptidase n=1 Tax=Microbulbifer halophilus TaxID=453963 RepID=A0ABW5EGP1_9GAMM|nr:S8 family serine peptidase [Microbulbifer halophilus]MCW8127413.1 S8 family serine peptidase [Microbulbifer halophilus]
MYNKKVWFGGIAAVLAVIFCNEVWAAEPRDGARRIIIQLEERVRLAGEESAPARPALRELVARHRERARRQGLLLDKLRRRGLAARAPQGSPRRFTRALNAIVTSARAADIDDIAALPEVRGVTLDHRVHALGGDSVEQVRAPQVWALSDGGGRALTGEGTSIAVIDSGIDYTHPDLGGCFGPGCKVVGGHDFVNDDDDPMDDYRHGTLVAGVAAADGSLRGVAPGAQLYAYKVLDSDGGGYTSDVIAAIEAALDPDGDPATDDAVDVINISLGMPGGNSSAISAAANAAVRAGTVVVAAAGNTGPGYDTIEAPGSAQRVLTVGAVDNEGRVPAFSARGLFAGGLEPDATSIKPELTAPGVAVRSTVPGGGYASSSGTSLAAPHVAGAAALMRQRYPRLDSAEIKSLLVNWAAPASGGIQAAGNGQLDALAAAQAPFLVSPAALYRGYFTDADTGKSAAVTVKNLAAQVEIGVEDTGELPAGAALTPENSRFTLGPNGYSSQSVALRVDPGRVDYPQDLHRAYSGALRFTADGQSVELPVAFHRAELLELSQENAPENYWSYSATAFGAGGQTSSALASFESDRPRLTLATRDGPVHVLFAAEHNDTIQVAENVRASDGPLVFPAGGGGFAVTTPTTPDGKPLQFVSQVVELTHRDYPQQHYRRVFGRGQSMSAIHNLSDGFRLDYFGLAEKTGNHPQDRQLYLLKHSQRGLFADLGFDLSGYGSVRMLVNSARWRQQGYSLAFAPGSYRPGGEVHRDERSVVPRRNDATLLTLHGNDGALESWPTYLNIGIDSDGSLQAGSLEFAVGRERYRKLRRSESDSAPAAPVLQRPNAPLMFGRGLRFWAGGLRNSGGGPLLEPSVNGDATQQAVMDSWGNGYRRDIRYNARCLETGNQIAGGTLNRPRLFSYGGGCQRVRVRFEYPTAVDDIDYRSTAELQLSTLDGAATPRIDMVALLEGGKVSSYAQSDGELLVRTSAQLSLELALDDGDWQPLEAVREDRAYRAALPEFDGAAIAHLRLTAASDSGNRLVNTIRGAFVLGGDAARAVDSDSDGAVDAADARPLNPRYSETGSGAAAFTALDTGDVRVERGQENVVVQAFVMEADVESELSSLTLRASGAGDDRADIALAELHWDRDGDGRLDDADTPLASGRFDRDDGRVTFPIDRPGPLVLPAGKHQFIVSYDFAP